MTIGELANRRVVALRPMDTAAAAAKVMRDKGIGCVLIQDGGKRLQGIVTDRDIVVSVLAAGLDPKTTTLESIMVRKVVTAPKDEIILRAARRMAEARIRRLPVVDGKGRVVGLVSVDDLLVLLITELSNVVAAIVGPSKLI
jgi:CBS domain-containing protein